MQSKLLFRSSPLSGGSLIPCHRANKANGNHVCAEDRQTIFPMISVSFTTLSFISPNSFTKRLTLASLSTIFFLGRCTSARFSSNPLLCSSLQYSSFSSWHLTYFLLMSGRSMIYPEALDNISIPSHRQHSFFSILPWPDFLHMHYFPEVFLDEVQSRYQLR